MSRSTIFLAIIVLFSTPLFAQHHEGGEETHEPETKNGIALFVGNTIITQSKFNLPTIGIEYVHELHNRFGIGIISEVEIGSHIIQKDETGDIIAEVDREGAFLILPAVFIRVVENLYLYGGYGVEFERKEDIGLLKMGLEYKFHLKNQKWIVLPNISWDHTHLFDGFVYGVNFGYVF